MLFRRNPVAVLVASSYFICREIIEEKYALELGRETRVLRGMCLAVVLLMNEETIKLSLQYWLCFSYGLVPITFMS